jgi:hypothetical protein
MLNGMAQAILSRNPIAISEPRLTVRGRKGQEPAATPAEVERGVTVLPSTTVRQALAEVWGWA